MQKATYTRDTEGRKGKREKRVAGFTEGGEGGGGRLKHRKEHNKKRYR
jgi:hypothetical protein